MTTTKTSFRCELCTSHRWKLASRVGEKAVGNSIPIFRLQRCCKPLLPSWLLEFALGPSLRNELDEALAGPLAGGGCFWILESGLRRLDVRDRSHARSAT